MDRFSYIKVGGPRLAAKVIPGSTPGPNNFEITLTHDPINKKTTIVEVSNGVRKVKELPDGTFDKVILKIERLFKLPNNNIKKMYIGHDIEVVINKETYSEIWSNKNKLTNDFEVKGNIDMYLQSVYSILNVNLIKLLHSFLTNYNNLY